MSDAAYNLFFLLRWLIYLVRRVLSVLYGLLAFVGKPGSRIIVPVVAVALAYLMRPYVHAVLTPYALEFDPTERPDPLLLDGIAVAAIVIGACAYVLLSRAVGLVLGAFPPLTRPLPPLRRIRLKARPVKPVVVSLKVPKLPRRRWKLRPMRVPS
jgi:hypothetical protein